MSLKDSAIMYSRAGFAIIPLAERGKIPAVQGGLKSACVDINNANEWWTKHEKSNIGIVCGAQSGGIVVIDLDVDEDNGKDGLSAMQDWEERFHELPTTACAMTGRHGMHYYYRVDRIIHPSTNAELGIDIRGDGSYVVAPPSIHENGNQYRWVTPLTQIADADACVYDFIQYCQAGDRKFSEPGAIQSFKLPKVIKKGERDNMLFKYACQLQEFGVDDLEIKGKIEQANQERCVEPLKQSELARIVNSATKYPKGSKNSLKTAHNESSTADKQDLPDPTKFLRKGGGIKHNMLAREIISRNHAAIIDGVPAAWTGKRWDMGVKSINRLCTHYVDSCKKSDKSEVVAYIQEQAKYIISSRDMDKKPYIQFKNGTWDVLGETFVEPRPEMYITNTLPVELKLNTKEGEADLFIQRLSAGDEQTQKLMCQVIGAAMCSKTIVSQSPMLIGYSNDIGGEASNGKSTFLKVLTALLGTQNVSSLELATLGKRFQASQIVGKLANIGDDIPNGFVSGEELSMFKKVVTGDTVYTDIKGGDGFSFTPRATLIFSMNEVPRLGDSSNGILRRIAFVPFRAHFTPDNENYVPNYDIVLNTPRNLQRLAYLGMCEVKELYEKGIFERLDDMEEELEQVRQENSSVVQWLDDERLIQQDFINKPTSQMYSRYCDWCRHAGIRIPFSKRRFTLNVTKEMGLERRSIRLPSGRYDKAFIARKA
ncbi:phage/plasmid primase, P4 family [Atopobium fossor]|uniref:phage/plasmid primase, P4 family n=1 Tax=Atopobium fossor TaxID=39487 RepID=UPI0004076EC8|nr:phage/plasmid primase, P4 family [Atopobium fossor]